MGWSELMLVGIVALIVIGPKDLPGLFFKMGEFAGKARGMAREFTNAMNDAARESGVGDIQKTLNAAANPKKFGVDKIREATGKSFEAGPATQALSEERAASKAKFEAAAADMVNKRKAAEAPVPDPDAPPAPEAASTPAPDQATDPKP
ncbi:twin-arginine translocase subunit TatB [Yoonia sp. 208BN28-4]|uniref:twin-arginine translocase subunit TatB n=1 Tax=Yoonia sp. 208BN28-4 TaxID=3126505 RepID=UPI0030A0309A